MQRFIQYLYEYKGGKPVRNVGFIKMEENRDKRTIHIHGKGFGREKQEVYIYLCYVENGTCIGVLCGKDTNINPGMNYRLEYGKEDIGRAPNLDAVKGIVIRNTLGNVYGAQWDTKQWALDDMVEEMPEIISNDVIEIPEAVPQEVQEEEGDEKVETEEVETDEVQYQVIEDEVMQSRYEKIRRQDLSRLPRREWPLANNRFLLHGYHNYHHLLLIEEEGECYLGVPGIYHPREETTARAFGFREFRRVGEADVELSAAEKNEEDDFGYWCRQVERIRV